MSEVIKKRERVREKICINTYIDNDLFFNYFKIFICVVCICGFKDLANRRCVSYINMHQYMCMYISICIFFLACFSRGYSFHSKSCASETKYIYYFVGIYVYIYSIMLKSEEYAALK